MIPLDQAVAQVLSFCEESQREIVPLVEAGGRVLAEPPCSGTDLPPFTTSSVDGYALKLPCPLTLEVQGEIPAGRAVESRLGHSSHAIQVFTGSMLPTDVDAVVMVEDTELAGNRLTIRQLPTRGDNLRRKGEELIAGSPLLTKGQIISPPVLALLANAGIGYVSVFRCPRVTVVETGNELRSPGEQLEPGEIFAANGLALASAAEKLGALVTRVRSSDDPAALKKAFSQALESSDVIITSGGVSVGKHDHVKAVWKSLGAEERFWRVAIRPGRPLFFATDPNGPLIFGLPGNPVSSLVTFFLVIRSALLAMSHRAPEPPTKARLSFGILSSDSVEIFERVLLKEGIAYQIDQQGSHMTSGLAEANALLRVPRGVGKLNVGASLEAQPLFW